VPATVAIVMYVVVVPAVCLVAIVCAVFFWLSPMGRGHRISVELRGAHLVWWLAWGATISAALSGLAVDLPGCVFGSVVAVAIGGMVAKMYVPVVGYFARLWKPYLYHRGYETYKRYYLFWARGIRSVAIALAPALGYALWWLGSGWLGQRGP
jgi:hypothetical protein